MPPKDQCQEHGESLAVLKEKVHTLEKGQEAMIKSMEEVMRMINNLKGAWVVIVVLAAFLSTVAGNVVSSRIISQTAVIHPGVK